MYYAGISKMDITPPVGYILSGHSARNKPSQKAHDNLYLKVLTVFNGEKRVVIVTSDLLGFTQEFVDKVREDMRKKINISAENSLLTASHTHTGPMMEQFPYDTEKPLDDY